MYNTRIAPSPTGDMHLGTARTAYFNYLVAKASGGTFMLRIDDTDKGRSKQEYTDTILETIAWLGLAANEILYQSKQDYTAVAKLLIDVGCAEYAENGAILLSGYGMFIPEEWEDEIAGKIKVSDQERQNIFKPFVLIKSNGTASYHFASVYDDFFNNINYIIRGVDHISNTAKQITLFNLLRRVSSGEDKPLPKFAHIGLIYQNKKKLSKRDKAASMLHYREQGYSPEAMLNYMLRLGWAESDGKTLKKIPKELAIEMFLDQGNMRSAPSGFDENLLNAINRRYK